MTLRHLCFFLQEVNSSLLLLLFGSAGEKSSVEVKRRLKKQKRKPGSPLLEMPDLSQTQTQNLDSGSVGSSEVVDLSQDSSQV